jgi:hypothetical protein
MTKPAVTEMIKANFDHFGRSHGFPRPSGFSAPGCLFFRLPTVENCRLLQSEVTNLPLLLCVDADRTNVLKVALLIVEPKQKLIPSASDGMIPETAYDTICASIVFDFNHRVIIPWSVRSIGALGDNTVELLSDVPDQFSQLPSSPPCWLIDRAARTDEQNS